MQKRLILSIVTLLSLIFFTVYCEIKVKTDIDEVLVLINADKPKEAGERWNEFYKNRWFQPDKNFCFAIDAAIKEYIYTEDESWKNITKDMLHMYIEFRKPTIDNIL